MSQSQELQNSRTDLLSTQNIDFKSRSIKNAGNAIDQQDYVTLSQLGSSIKTAIDEIPNKLPSTQINGIVKQGIPGAVLFIGANGKLAQDSTKFSYSNGKVTLFDTILLGSLTVSKPVKSDANKNLVSGLIVLTTDVSGILPVPNGGSGAATFTANSVLIGNGTGAFQVQAGITGSLVLGTTSATPGSGSGSVSTSTGSIQYKDWAGANQTATFLITATGTFLTSITGSFLTTVTLTTNAFTKGVRST